MIWKDWFSIIKTYNKQLNMKTHLPVPLNKHIKRKCLSKINGALHRQRQLFYSFILAITLTIKTTTEKKSEKVVCCEGKYP